MVLHVQMRQKERRRKRMRRTKRRRMRRWRRTLRQRLWPRSPAGRACACAKPALQLGHCVRVVGIMT